MPIDAQSKMFVVSSVSTTTTVVIDFTFVIICAARMHGAIQWNHGPVV